MTVCLGINIFSARGVVVCATPYHRSNHQATSNTRMGSKDKNSIKWTPPPLGVVKINFYGSVLQQSFGAVVGFVLRDDVGCPIVFDARCIGKANVHVTEATALRDGLLKAKEMNVKNVVVEGDSSLVINCVNMKFKCPWKLIQIIQDIIMIATFFDHISFHHVLREVNFVANALVNFGHKLSNPSCWEVNFYVTVRQVLNFDLFGAGCS
ncbi:PREDICTED: uncharacterized protein LOC101292043 [Fragaria vesca subsp. vesca]